MTLITSAANLIKPSFLVSRAAADEGERSHTEIQAHVTFRNLTGVKMRFVACGDLMRNREAMARFGHGLEPIERLAHTLG